MDRVRIFKNSKGDILYLQGYARDFITKDVLGPTIEDKTKEELYDYNLIFDSYASFKKDTSEEDFKYMNGTISVYLKEDVRRKITLGELIKTKTEVYGWNER